MPLPWTEQDRDPIVIKLITFNVILRWVLHFSLIFLTGLSTPAMACLCCMLHAAWQALLLPREAEFRETSAGEVVPLRLPEDKIERSGG